MPVTVRAERVRTACFGAAHARPRPDSRDAGRLRPHPLDLLHPRPWGPPNTNCLLRLAMAVLQEQHHEWQGGKRHFSQEALAL